MWWMGGGGCWELLRKTAGVWSETERGSPAAKVERAEPVRRRERQ